MNPTALVILRIVGLASGKGDHPFDGFYIVAYDVHALGPGGHYDGGKLEVSKNRDHAKRMTLEDAIKMVQSKHGMRADGHPNRPLTAFNMLIEAADQAESASIH